MIDKLKQFFLRNIWGNSFGRVKITKGGIHIGPNPYTGSGGQPGPH